MQPRSDADAGVSDGPQQVVHGFDIERSREQEPLTGIDGLGPQKLKLVVGFDSLGDNLEPERLTELDERMDDGRRLGAFGDH